MGTTTLETRFSINGLLATENTVLDNLTKLCNATGAWLTYDTYLGKWSVIINKAGASVKSFDDSNIIGPININGTGLNNLYNSVSITYPHEDLKDQKDVQYIEIPNSDRNPNEPDNELNLTYDIVTNPVQAQLLGFMELKQSRVDKIVTFRTDFRQLGIKAGDIIDITNSIYGFTNKKFRIVTVRELDADDGSIQLDITALEYDDAVYDTTNLDRYTRSDASGILGIGSIPAPDQPVVTTYSNVSRPRVECVTNVNGGLVDRVEFWYTSDVPPDYVVDSNRTYTLLGSVAPDNGGTFDAGADVTFSIDSLSAGSFLIKARAMNSVASSEFSAPSGVVYAPVQTTDAIGPDTQAIDENGNLLNMAGLTGLLALMDSFFSGNSSSGGSSSGNGTTFLLLEIQSFNGNMTTGGKAPGYGSRFVPVVRIVPPGVSSTIEGINQTSFSQCLIGDGSGVGGYSYPLGDYTPTNWPQYYPHKILQRVPSAGYTPNTANVALGQYEAPVVYAVDLGVYKYYYPTATKFELEIRGYWQLEDQTTQISTTNTSSANITVYDSSWQPTTAGTGNIKVAGAVFTNASGWQAAHNTSLVPPSWSTRGIGSSANVIVTSTVYPYQLGSNVELSSTGDHITTFSYDFTKQRNKAPKFNPYNFSTPIKTTIDVPITWSIGLQGNVVGNVTPTSNITISSIPKNIGTTEVALSTSGPAPVTGLYEHYAQKVTRYAGRIDMPISGYHNQDNNVVFPDVVPLPLTANVFSYNYVRSQSTAVANIGPTYTPTPVTEWYSVYVGKSGQYGNPYLVSDGGDFANASPYNTFYSNMSKVTATSTAFVPVNPLNKSIGRANEQYVPYYWGQAKSTANVGATTITSFNWWGVVANGQYYDNQHDDLFPYIDNGITFPTGLFFNGNAGNATSSINHVAITGNTNANVNADNGLGYWVTGTISS
jgi:hypothetical protein